MAFRKETLRHSGGGINGAPQTTESRTISRVALVGAGRRKLLNDSGGNRWQEIRRGAKLQVAPGLLTELIWSCADLFAAPTQIVQQSCRKEPPQAVDYGALLSSLTTFNNEQFLEPMPTCFARANRLITRCCRIALSGRHPVQATREPSNTRSTCGISTGWQVDAQPGRRRHPRRAWR